MLRLTRLEKDELVDHFQSRPDIWEDGGSMWLRTDSEGATLLGVKLVPPTTTSPWATWIVAVLPDGMTLADAETYVRQLVLHWTSYSVRCRVANFLQDELKLATTTALAAATYISSLYFETTDAPEEVYQQPLPDILPVSRIPPDEPKQNSRTWQAEGSGNVTLHLQGDMFRVVLHLPEREKRTPERPAFTDLEGHVRPVNFREHGPGARDAASRMFGWEEQKEKADDPEPVEDTGLPGLSS